MNFVKGDIVKVGLRGGVEYLVTFEMREDGKVEIQSQNTGKFQWIDAGRLVMVESWASGEEVRSEFEEAPEASPAPDSYTLAIFVALQRKPIFQGFLNPLKPRKVRASRRLRKMAKNARRAQRAA